MQLYKMSADDQNQWGAGWACQSVGRRRKPTARGQGLSIRRRTAQRRAVRACRSICGRTEPTAIGTGQPLRRRTAGTKRAGPIPSVRRGMVGTSGCRLGLPFRRQTAVANGVVAWPVSESADGRDQRRAVRTCRSVGGRQGPAARGPGLPVRKRTAGTNGARSGLVVCQLTVGV